MSSIVQPSYNHAFTLAFEVSGSKDPEGNDITGLEYARSLLFRIGELAKDESVWEGALGAPFDTFEELPGDDIRPYTVIGFYDDTGQVVFHHIEAKSDSSAFARAAQELPTLRILLALPGHHSGATGLVVASESVVGVEAIPG